eukprot:COSAG01_NODE_6892_length_3448_cov_131.689758_2_plen_59_part_00
MMHGGDQQKAARDLLQFVAITPAAPRRRRPEAAAALFQHVDAARARAPPRARAARAAE